MRKLIIVRHAYYDQTSGRLSEYGRQQMVLLGSNLTPFVQGGSITLIASPEDRTVESAKILGGIFEVVHQTSEAIWASDRREANINEALNLVREHQDGADSLVLVTHSEFVVALPRFYVMEMLPIPEETDDDMQKLRLARAVGQGLRKDQAVVIDHEEGVQITYLG